VAFKFADSPDFHEALSVAQARLQDKTSAPMVTSASSPSAAPDQSQLKVGEAGQFADDNEQFPGAVEDRAMAALNFRDYFEDGVA
jgi:hypothetical protein